MNSKIGVLIAAGLVLGVAVPVASAATPAATTVTLTATTAASSAATSALHLSAKVSAGSGSVTFYAGPSGLGATTLGTAPISAKTATLTPAPDTVPVGDLVISARYDGDSTHAVSVSAPVLRQRYYLDVPPTSSDFTTAMWSADHDLFLTPADGKFAAGKIVSHQGGANALYQFVEPKVSAPACTSEPYGNVATTAAFCPQIAWLYGLNVEHGAPFNRTAPLTRGELALWSYAAEHAGVAAPACSLTPVSDLSATNIVCGAVAWSLEQEVMSTTSTAVFSATTGVTRLALATTLQKLGSDLGQVLYARVNEAGGEQFLLPIRTATDTTGAAIPIPSDVTAAAVAPGATTAYLAGRNSDLLTFLETISLPSGKVLRMKTLPALATVSEMVVSGDGTKLFTVADDDTSATGTVTSFSTPGLGTVKTVSTSGEAFSLVSAGDTVAWGTQASPGHQLHSVNTSTGVKGPTIAVANGAIRLTEDGSYGWVMGGPGGAGLTATLVDLKHGTFGTPYYFGHGFSDLQIIGTGTGSIGVATAGATDDLVTIDLATRTALPAVPIGRIPGQIALASYQHTAYVVGVSNTANPVVVPVNLLDQSAQAPITTGGYYLGSLLPQPTS